MGDGRFRLRDRVAVRPGACFICRGTNGPFVDTLASVPWEGAVYVCKTCIEGMYQTLEIPVEPVEDRYDEGFLDGGIAAKDSVMEALKSYVAEYDAATSSPADGISDSASSSVSPEVPEPSKGTNRKSKSSSDGTESNSKTVVSRQPVSDKSDESTSGTGSKSDSESGRLDLSSVTSDDFSAGISF